MKRFEWDINNHAPSEVQMRIIDAGPWIRNAILSIAVSVCVRFDPNLANRLINAAQKYLIARLWKKIQI